VLRDPTRGGVAASLNEIAAASGIGIVIQETKIPVRAETQSACELLGLDPLCVANEGKLIAIAPREVADSLVDRMRAHPRAAEATIIGHVTHDHAGLVIAETSIGGKRVVAMQVGEQLPRIC
jgi:hydrogenase expression/formation protein HypE